MHGDLIITGEGIHETQGLVARSRINKLINLGEGEAVLWAGAVEVSVVYTHSPLPIGFRDHDHVSDPLWVPRLSVESGAEELVHFFLYCYVSVRG